jgi:hypothetical protein
MELNPRRLREQVKRNQKRFPADFTFQLNEKEISLMVSQNAIPSVKHLGGTNPYVFTEQGVAALSSILTSDIAIDISIKIMRAFVEMRKFLISNAQIFQRLDRVELNQIENDRKFDKIFSLMESGELKPKQGIFFENQAYDAYNFVSNIVKSAGKSVLVIDNYVDDSVLTILSKRKSGVKASIYTKNISAQLKLDVKKFNEQYGPVEVLEFDDSHDRFIVIDEKIIYHFGASLKNLGKKWFGFSKMDIEAVEMLSRLGK